MITVSPGSRATPASHLGCKATAAWPECWTHFISPFSEFMIEPFYKFSRSFPRISGTKIPQVCANPAFLRIKLCFIVGKNGVLQAGNNVFDVKIIPMVNSKNLFGGDTLKSLPKLIWTFLKNYLFFRELFKQWKKNATIPVPSCTCTHTQVPHMQLQTAK